MKTIGALLALALTAGVSTAAMAQAKPAIPNLRICTGGEKGNYFFFGNAIWGVTKKRFADKLTVEVKDSLGSLDNIDRMVAGDCDAAIVQGNALRIAAERDPRSVGAVARVTTLATEYAHLICRRADKISSIKDLTKKHKVAVGPDGSGSALTWQDFGIADANYKPASQDGSGPELDNQGDLGALFAVKDGDDVNCMLFMASLGAPLIRENAAKMGKDLVLVDVDDWDFNDEKDAKGNTIYTFGTIPSGTYGAVQDGAVDSVSVPAVLVITPEWRSKNTRAYTALLDGMTDVQALINLRINKK